MKRISIEDFVQDPFLSKIEDYTYGKVLGSGQFGVVDEGFHKVDSIFVQKYFENYSKYWNKIKIENWGKSCN